MVSLLLLLFILNLGIAFGAGLYEARIVLPQWFHALAGGGYRIDATAMRDTDVGRRFWGFTTTLPLTLLTLANGWLAWQSVPPVRAWWLAAVLVTLAERLATFTFFIPTAIRLQQADNVPVRQAGRLVNRWIRLNYGRLLLNLLAWLLALHAFSLLP